MLRRPPGPPALLFLGGALAQDLFVPSQPHRKEYTTDARGFEIRRYRANFDVSESPPARRGPHWLYNNSFAADLSAFPAICDAAIVEDTCRLFNGDPGGGAQNTDSVVPSDVRGVLSATAESVVDFWEVAGLPVPAGCADLCRAAVAWLRRHGHAVPPRSDLGCRGDPSSGEHACDIDLSPALVHDAGGTGQEEDILGDFGSHGGDALDEHGRPISARPGASGVENEGAAGGDDDIEYHLGGIAVEVAHMFRVYPEVVAAVRIEEGLLGEENSSRRSDSTLRGDREAGRRLWSWPWGIDFPKQIVVTEQKAIAYIATALREFQRRSTSRHMRKWFGAQAVNHPGAHHTVHNVLLSINRMLSHVEYVYPGPECSMSTYAYVYPKSFHCHPQALKDHPCTTTGGKYVFYMCSLAMYSGLATQIETLTHEGSHHATAFTDDVCMDDSNPCKNKAYGRSSCADLAKNNPYRAIRNADNYCYYIQDITDVR